MANLKEIRTRIDSITTTKQVTNAMKMVSAAKFRKAQGEIVQIKPYSKKLLEVLEIFRTQATNIPNLNVTDERPLKRILIVVINSNRGLCGSFNSNIHKKIEEITARKYSSLLSNKGIDFITFGKKASQFLNKNKYNVIQDYSALYDNLIYEKVAPIAEDLMNRFTKGRYDKISIVYNQLKNAATQTLVEEQYLPLKKKKKEDDMELDYIFAPDKNSILLEIIPRTLKIQLFKAILDSNAAEQGARMTAMNKATENATELISELVLKYNKIRQASITNEILEIVGGAEAIN